MYALANSMKKAIPTRTIKTGLFSKISDVVNGEDVAKWLEKNNYTTQEQGAKLIIESLLDYHFLEFASANTRHKEFFDSAMTFYHFQLDLKSFGAANTFKIWTDRCRPAKQVASDLINKMNILLKQLNRSANKTSEAEITKLNENKAFSGFLESSLELQDVDIKSLQKDEKIAFFMNIYQVMHTHKLLLPNMEASQQKKPKISVLSKEKFSYLISGKEYTIEDILYGLIRKRKPKATSRNNVGSKTPDKKPGEFRDCRVGFLFHRDQELPKELEEFTANDYEQKLDKLVADVLRNTVTYDKIGEEKQKQDFPKDVYELMKWIWKYFKFHSDLESILQGLKAGKIKIEYL